MSYPPDDFDIPQMPSSFLLVIAMLALSCAIASVSLGDYGDAAILGGSAVLLAVGGLCSREQ